MKNILFLASLLFCITCGFSKAYAIECEITESPGTLDFGPSYNGDELNTSGTLGYRCRATVDDYFPRIAACYSVEPGGGHFENGIRYMIGISGAALGYKLQYYILDAAFGSGVGARYTASFGSIPVEVKPTTGVGTIWSTYTKRTLSGWVPKQTSVPAGEYRTVSTIAVTYKGNNTSSLGCYPGGGHVDVPMVVKASLQTVCNVQADDIDFGSYSNLSDVKTAKGLISVNCDLNTPYQISLETNGRPADARWMKNGDRHIEYGLFKDAAYQQPWGTDTPLDGVGDGIGQKIPVYARVLPQTTPTPGVYIDTVTVTVNY
ncbi:Csu type fimbrial protein [Bartonella sp. LJL80]